MVPTEDPEVEEIRRQAAAARHEGRADEARRLYRKILDRRWHDVPALRALRDLAVEAEAWEEALDRQQRLLAVAAPAERSRESEWLAVIHYRLGQGERARNRTPEALAHFRQALRTDREFLPAALALGETLEAAGDRREAVRTWERAVQQDLALPVLERLARAYRDEGRPSRMIALYREALGRAPDDLALAFGLGRVFFELEMLDEAADQFSRVETRAPSVAAVHAYLGAILEHRGETQEAFEEYRRALRLGGVFEWPHRCRACQTLTRSWSDRCGRCGLWNTLEPAPGS